MVPEGIWCIAAARLCSRGRVRLLAPPPYFLLLIGGQTAVVRHPNSRWFSKVYPALWVTDRYIMGLTLGGATDQPPVGQQETPSHLSHVASISVHPHYNIGRCLMFLGYTSCG